MRSEWTKTFLFVLMALVLVIAANRVEPEAAVPNVMSDEGEPLFPDFRDIADVKAIEVVGYDEQQAVAQPLKVEFRKGRWILPSHNDYPAEVAERLDKTAGALLGLKRDLVLSDRVEDQGTYGVIDPLDTKATALSGRGKHVTLRDGQGGVLADVVLGKPVPDHPGYRCMRLPGKKRIYGVKSDADPSSRFEDWVSGNLLGLSVSNIRKITINSYSIDENLGRVTGLKRMTLTRNGSKWKREGDGKFSNQAAARVASALTTIHIVGARPKPKSLAEQLRKGALEMTLETVMSLRQHGFFVTPNGRLYANEGEMVVDTKQGIVYTLRFGEIVRGASGTSTGDNKPEAQGQDRYVFITVHHDPKLEALYGTSARTAANQRRARSLGRRFADWYYIISGADFARLHGK